MSNACRVIWCRRLVVWVSKACRVCVSKACRVSKACIVGVWVSKACRV